MGRRTKYIPEYNQQAKELALLGATDKAIAEFLEVDESQIVRWKRKYPEFRLSIRAGKLMADGKVAEALYRKATGFIIEVQEAFDCNGKPQLITFEKYFPPDTSAIRLWLTNRQKETWRDRQSVGVEFEHMSENQINDLFEKLIKHNEQSK